MLEPPHVWSEKSWVDEPEGSPGIFFRTGDASWLCLWFLETEPAGRGCNAGAPQENGSQPFAAPELGSCGR